MIRTIISVTSWLSLLGMSWLFFLDIVTPDVMSSVMWGLMGIMVVFSSVPSEYTKRK